LNKYAARLWGSLLFTGLIFWALIAYAACTDGPVYGFWISDNRLHFGEFSDLYGCYRQLAKLQTALEAYASDHRGLLPPARGPRDYYYWLRGLRPYIEEPVYRPWPEPLYCPLDHGRQEPSSYISDPRLAGKKLAELEKIPGLVLLRERNFRHVDQAAAFTGNALRMEKQAFLPPNLKFNPRLPESQLVNIRFYYFIPQNLPFWLCLLTAALLADLWFFWGWLRRGRGDR